MAVLAWYCHKNRQVDQWNQTGDSDTYLHTHGHLIFGKEAKMLQWIMGNLFHKWCCYNWMLT